MLKVEHVEVALGAKQILRNISLEVADGEFLALIGPSGCGKSTLLKTICGIIAPCAGHIFLDRTCLDRVPINHRNIVMLFQDLRLFPNMLAWENVAFPLKMRGVKKEERKAKAYDWLRQVSLNGLENRKIYELSGGQQQRVALARAYAASPKQLLLDEPFSSLDEDLKIEMRQLLIKLHKTHHISVIFVSHDRAEAKMLSDRVIVMKDGQLCHPM